MPVDINEILNKKIEDMNNEEKNQLLQLFKNALNGVYHNEKAIDAIQDQLNGLSERVSNLGKRLNQMITEANKHE